MGVKHILETKKKKKILNISKNENFGQIVL